MNLQFLLIAWPREIRSETITQQTDNHKVPIYANIAPASRQVYLIQTPNRTTFWAKQQRHDSSLSRTCMRQKPTSRVSVGDIWQRCRFCYELEMAHSPQYAGSIQLRVYHTISCRVFCRRMQPNHGGKLRLQLRWYPHIPPSAKFYSGKVLVHICLYYRDMGPLVLSY